MINVSQEYITKITSGYMEQIAAVITTDTTKAQTAFSDNLISINGREIRDVLDYRFFLAEREITLTLLRNGEEYELRGVDLLARAICHECDHLDGKLYTDVQIEALPNED